MTYTLIDSMSDRALPTGASPAPQIRSTFTHPASKRVPIKHVLLGAPPAVTHTIHRLHQLHYAEATLWSTLLAIPDIAPQPLRDVAPQRWRDRPIMLAPNPGDVLAILVRYLNLE